MSAPLIEALCRQLGARRVETHISWVLLFGHEALKIKKPVNLGFLDFSTLAARHQMCGEELRLNRRLAPSLYVEVVPITGRPAAPRIGGPGTPIEWALRMRRFPDDALLADRLQAADVRPAQIDRLAQRLAAFHRSAAVADAASPYGRPERIAADTAAVIERLAPRLPPAQAAAPALLREWAGAQARELQPTWLARLRDGCVREGHGDLHAGNVVVLADDVTAFDCIEFDPALRWIDLQADIGFLVMDLLAHGRRDLAFRFLDRYLAEGGDHAGVAVLRYYLVYRALVRALVAALRPAAPGGPDYLGLALHWLRPPGARLLITHGLSGSGKSHAAAGLLEQAGAVRLRSDLERKRLHGLAPLQASASGLGAGLYAPQATQATYTRLAELADIGLRAGWPVIVDATFLRAAEREQFRLLARRHRVPFTILHCQAPEVLLRERLAARARRADDASEADASVLAHQLSHAEPLDGRERGEVIALDSAQCASPEAMAALAARWAAAVAG